jgi:uncharacterized protein (TIRG00374 family)
MKRLLKICGIVLWLLALALVAWMLWQLPLDAIAGQIAALSAMDWLTWVLVNVLVILLLTLRWQLLARLLRARIPLLTLLQIRQGGQAATFLIPGPHVGGEPLQLYWLCKHCRLPLPVAILALGLDRLFELGLNALVFTGSVALLLLTPTLEIPDWQQGLAVVVVLALVLLLLVRTLQRKPRWLAQHFERLAQPWRQHERLRQFSQHWQRNWQQVRSEFAQVLATGKRRLLLAALFSALGWLAMLAELALLLYFLGLTPALFDVVLLVVAMRVALLLPAPGGIGPVEAALLWAFQLLDLPLTAAASLIVLMRLRDLCILLLGLACAWNLGRNKAT